MKKWAVRHPFLLALGVLITIAIFFAQFTGAPQNKHLHWPRRELATPFAQRQIIVDGIRLRYIDEGKGLPLLLIPGHTSRIEEFDQMTDTLRKHFRVLSFDFPGSGYSDKPNREYNLTFFEDVAFRFLDALGVSKCYLAGGSLGGNLTLRLAHRAPERFERLVVWSPAGAWESSPASARTIRAIGNYSLFLITIRVQSGYWYSERWPGREMALRETFLYYEEVLSPEFVLMYWGIIADQLGSSLFTIVSEVKQPTLLIWGDEDSTPGMGDGVKRITKLMPHATLLVYRGAGHALSAERPRELSQAIDEYLSRPDDQLR